MPRGHKLSWEERYRRYRLDREWREKRLKEHPLKSPCLGLRLKHSFRSPNTRSLTDDLTCRYCGKTVAQVKKEQRRKPSFG